MNESPHGKWYNDACGTAFALELIGERWSLLIVRELTLGGRRFSDIRASLPGISAKVLTERLDRLEAIGVLKRKQLSPPISVQVYELTEWGYELELVMQALGRWAVRSPLHNPMLPLTPISFMLSLRTMLDPVAAGDLSLTVLFEIGADRFLGKLHDGDLAVERAGDEVESADLVFRAPDGTHFLPVFYGKYTPAEAGVSLEIEGNAKLAQRLIDSFRLPPKCGTTD